MNNIVTYVRLKSVATGRCQRCGEESQRFVQLDRKAVCLKCVDAVVAAMFEARARHMREMREGTEQ